MKKLLSCSLVLISIVALLSTCSDPEEMMPPTGAGDTIITIEERMEVFEACKKKSAELNNLEGLEDRINFLTWLATQPAFYSYGFAGEDLYAIFVDGRIVLFVNTPLGEDIGGRKATDGRFESRPSSNNPNGRTEDLPKSKKVSLFTGLGALFPNNVEELKNIFSVADAGYQVEIKDATIENLKAVSGDAVFYFDTHGGAGKLHTKKGPREIMALWTKESVTTASEVNYKDELDAERMSYMLATNNTRAAEFHYSITSSFVREYMSFGENCLIYLDACNGMNESITGNVTFRERTIAKAVNQKATFVGWTGVTNSRDAPLASQFFFDRLLGANSGGDISQEDPYQRPFDIAPVIEDMRNEGLGVVHENGAYLAYKTTMEHEVLLRPTIESIEVNEYTSMLIIKGLFPWDPGNVTVNGVSAVVTSWNPYAITCTIRETGDGSVGDVVVVSAHGIKSNRVPLTEYHIKLNYSADDNGIKFAGVADLRLRADVHLRRSAIGETPTKPTYIDYSPGSGFIFNVKGSSAAYTLTGRKYDACNRSNCFVQFSETPTIKVGTLPYSLPTSPDHPFFAMYNWGPDMKSIKINIIAIGILDLPLAFEERIQCPDIPEVVIPVQATYNALFGFPTNEFKDFITIEIAENYNMRPGSWTRTISRPWSTCSGTGTFKQTLNWEVIIPKHAPTDETDARVASDANGD